MSRKKDRLPLGVGTKAKRQRAHESRVPRTFRCKRNVLTFIGSDVFNCIGAGLCPYLARRRNVNRIRSSQGQFRNDDDELVYLPQPARWMLPE